MIDEHGALSKMISLIFCTCVCLCSVDRCQSVAGVSASPLHMHQEGEAGSAQLRPYVDYEQYNAYQVLRVSHE